MRRGFKYKEPKIVLVSQVGQTLYRLSEGRDGKFWLMVYNHEKLCWDHKHVTDQTELDQVGIKFQIREAA
jgi:hypothetical protein